MFQPVFFFFFVFDQPWWLIFLALSPRPPHPLHPKKVSYDPVIREIFKIYVKKQANYKKTSKKVLIFKIQIVLIRSHLVLQYSNELT